MKNRASDALLKCGMPCNIKGFQYIVYAMVLFDNGWANRKTCELYKKIAEDINTTASRVERAIRHSFQTHIYVCGGNSDVENYFDLDNQKNGAQLSCFYYRLCRERDLEGTTAKESN